MIISPVQVSDLAAAIALLRGSSGAASEHRTTSINLSSGNQVEASDILVARNDDMCGAIIARKLPGGVGIIGAPRTLDGDPDIADALIVAALRHLTGVKIVEAFCSPLENDLGNSLLRTGFTHVTRIWELRRPLQCPLASADRIALVPYVADPTAFRRILVQCHQDSLDCPEIHGRLTEDELLEGYRDCAPDMGQWWLAKSADEYVGTIILASQTLAFIGVVPAKRGQGFGRGMIESTTQLSPELSLVVDERNAPAIQLYVSAGFALVGSHDVYLNFLSEPQASEGRKSSGLGD